MTKRRTRPVAAAKRQNRNARRTEEAAPLEVPLDDPVFLLPWFLPKQVYLAVRRILPNIHIAKMRYYFDDYGCIRCERKDVLYRTNGLCERCNAIVRWRLTECLKRRLRKVGVAPRLESGEMSRGLNLAQDLLRPFRRR